MRSTLVTIAILATLIVGGCPPVSSSGGGATESGPVLSEGIYTGSVLVTTRTYLNDTVVDETSSTLTRTETINAAGLPVLPTGAAARPGDRFVLSQGSTNALTGTVDAISAADNRLVLDIAVEGTVAGTASNVTVTGTAQMIYTPLDDRTLDFRLALVITGTDASGNTFLQTEDQSGTLTR